MILPLHDPLRVAEDVAVLDLASGGRVDLVIGAGYVPAEFAMFERAIADRPRLVEEGMQALMQAWTGEPFEYRGRTVRVTPRPLQRPRPSLALGGSSPASARRAARLADRFVPALPQLWKHYRAERERLGQPVPPGGRVGPLFLHVAEDPDARVGADRRARAARSERLRPLDGGGEHGRPVRADARRRALRASGCTAC